MNEHARERERESLARTHIRFKYEIEGEEKCENSSAYGRSM